MDINEIQLEVFRQTGISIDSDDPFFVALAMLSEMTNVIDKKHDVILEKIQKASESYNRTRFYWHNQNEQLMIGQVKEVKTAALDITGLKWHLTEVVAEQTKIHLQPILSHISEVSDKLQRKDGLALEQLRKTSATQERWSKIAHNLIFGFFVSAMIFGLCGIYVGNLVASKEIAKNAEWLDSEDGKYALQLRDAGSLKQLATCYSGQESSGWKIKDGKSCIPSPVQTKDGYLTTGWKIK